MASRASAMAPQDRWPDGLHKLVLVCQMVGGREGGVGQDKARKEPAQEVVKRLKARVTKPDPLA